MDLQNFHSLLEGMSGAGIAQAEEQINYLIQNNPALLLQLLVASIQTFTDKTVQYAIVLLGRTATLIGPKLLNIGDQNFHTTLQSSLLSLIQSNITNYNLVPSLSNAISTFAAVYKEQLWPNLSISLFQLIIQPQGGLVSPQPNAPFSSYISTDILWRCINNESILLNQENINYIVTLLQAILLQNPLAVESHQLISTARLAFSTFSKIQNDQLASFSIPIVKIIPQIPPNILNEYLNALSFFSDSNALFFEPVIGDLLTILVQLINNFEQIAEPPRNSCINILTQIINNDKFFDKICPQAFNFYELFITILGRSTFDLDPESGLQKSNTVSITEDAITDLSENFSEAVLDVFTINICEMFITCLNKNNASYAVANLIGYSKAVSGSPMIYNPGDPRHISEFLNVYRNTITAQDPKIRLISVESLNDVMKSLGKYIRSYNAAELLPILASAVSNETVQVILTQLLKSLKIYLKYFEDFKPFCGQLMELLGGRFLQMTEEQQILVMKCYKHISFMLKQDFERFLPVILTFIQQLFASYRPDNANFPFNLFFTCMEIAPQLSCINQQQFVSLSQSILSIIASINDITSLSSRQIDSINGAICAILKKNPEQFLPFAAKIVAIVMNLAARNIEFVSYPVDSNSNYSDIYTDEGSIVLLNSKNNTIDIYSSSSINSICEALNTLNKIIKNVNQIVKLNDFVPNLVNVILKTFAQGSVSNKIIFNLFILIKNFFVAVKKNGLFPQMLVSNQGTKPIAVQIYLEQVNSLTKIVGTTKNYQDFVNIDSFISNLSESFLFFAMAFTKLQDNSQAQIFADVLNSTILFIVYFYQMTMSVRMSTVRVADFSDDILYVSAAENKIGQIFLSIFCLMSSLIPAEMDNFLCNTFSFQQQQQQQTKNGGRQFVSKIVFDFWKYYVQFSKGCPRERALQIVQALIGMIEGGAFEDDVTLSSISTILHIVIGAIPRVPNGDQTSFSPNSYGFDDLLPSTVQFLSGFLNQNRQKIATSFASCVTREIIVIAQRLVELTPSFDPSPCLQILVSLMPITRISSESSFDAKDDDDEIALSRIITNMNTRSAQDLLKLSQNQANVAALRTIEGIVTFVAIAAIMEKNVDSAEVKNALRMFIVSVVNNQQTGQQVILNMQQVYANVLKSENVLELVKSIVNQTMQQNSQ